MSSVLSEEDRARRSPRRVRQENAAARAAAMPPPPMMDDDGTPPPDEPPDEPPGDVQMLDDHHPHHGGDNVGLRTGMPPVERGLRPSDVDAYERVQNIRQEVEWEAAIAEVLKEMGADGVQFNVVVARKSPEHHPETNEYVGLGHLYTYYNELPTNDDMNKRWGGGEYWLTLGVPSANGRKAFSKRFPVRIAGFPRTPKRPDNNAQNNVLNQVLDLHKENQRELREREEKMISLLTAAKNGPETSSAQLELLKLQLEKEREDRKADEARRRDEAEARRRDDERREKEETRRREEEREQRRRDDEKREKEEARRREEEREERRRDEEKREKEEARRREEDREERRRLDEARKEEREERRREEEKREKADERRRQEDNRMREEAFKLQMANIESQKTSLADTMATILQVTEVSRKLRGDTDEEKSEPFNVNNAIDKLTGVAGGIVQEVMRARTPPRPNPAPPPVQQQGLPAPQNLPPGTMQVAMVDSLPPPPPPPPPVVKDPENDLEGFVYPLGDESMESQARMLVKNLDHGVARGFSILSIMDMVKKFPPLTLGTIRAMSFEQLKGVVINNVPKSWAIRGPAGQVILQQVYKQVSAMDLAALLAANAPPAPPAETETP